MSSILLPIDSLNLLNIYNFSNVTSVDMDSSVITSFYSKYLILFNIMPGSDDAEIIIRTSTDNGATIDAGTGYSRTGVGTNAATVGLGSVNVGASSIVMNSTAAGNGVGNVIPEAGCGTIWILNKGDASNYPTISYDHSLLDSTAARTSRMQGCGHRRNAATINFIQILPSADSMSGVINIYGVI